MHIIGTKAAAKAQLTDSAGLLPGIFMPKTLNNHKLKLRQTLGSLHSLEPSCPWVSSLPLHLDSFAYVCRVFCRHHSAHGQNQQLPVHGPSLLWPLPYGIGLSDIRKAPSLLAFCKLCNTELFKRVFLYRQQSSTVLNESQSYLDKWLMTVIYTAITPVSPINPSWGKTIRTWAC